MGKCWNCDKDVFLKDEEVRCDNCMEVVRYWCHSCKQPFDVQNKENKKQNECKWCGYFKCPGCGICGENCQSKEHVNFISQILKEILSIDKWDMLNVKAQKIVDYFEEVKMGRKKTTCEFGVPKTYAKERIKQILARMDGFKVRDIKDQQAFEEKQEEVLDKEEGYEFTIGNTRDNGSYGQEYRDVFNLCVCLGKLKYERKTFVNEKGIEIGYDNWTRVEENPCKFLDDKNLVVKSCTHCKKVFSESVKYCDECTYVNGGKKHEKGTPFELQEKLSNNPTCKNLSSFKNREDKKSGESKFKGDD